MNLFPQAKKQVEIIQRISEVRNSFYRWRQDWPKRLYIGQMDYRDLRRECDVGMIQATNDKERFMNMEIFRVDRDYHLDVA